MRARGGCPRPTKAFGPVAGSIGALLGWAAVAHNSGSGWVQGLGGLLAGFVVVGLAGPAVACARLRLRIESNPADGTVGRPVAIGVVASQPMRIEPVGPVGPAKVVGPDTGRFEVVPNRRGDLREVTIAVASAAPFGLLWWRKKMVIPLVRPLWVAPVAGPPDPALLAGSTLGAILERQVPRDSRFGEPRGVRPYEAGDPQRLVHWPATAHRGELMVREAERPEAAVPEVWVVLPDDGPAGDAVAERALGTVLALLARTSPVMLATIEREGSRVEPVYSPTDAGRRLARAVANRGGPGVSLAERIKTANKPGPPEHSVLLRVASTGALAVGIAACAAEGELSVAVAGASIVAVVLGNLFSYHRRARPLPGLKIVLAVVAVAAFWRFYLAISAAHGVTNLGAVEGPLAVLFTWIQVTHAFDVPSRRDIAFSVAGSATLMAVAAAQALDMSFGLYVVAWAAFTLVAMAAMWGSMSGGGRPRMATLVVGALTLGVVALACLVALPAPSVSSRLVFPSAIGGDVSIASPAGLEGTASGATFPVRAGTSGGRAEVGGFLGFAGPLDTAVRGALGDELVFRVRATQPSFWVAETFDNWDGQSWTEVAPKNDPGWHQIGNGPPFALGSPPGAQDIQTFYLVQPGPNLVFHAEVASSVWFPAKRLFADADGNVRSGTSMGSGSIYTVVSSVDNATTGELAAAPPPKLSSVNQARFTELPHPYPRVAALAARITAHATDTEAKVLALEHWMSVHTRYTTDIPPLPKGADTVDEFLFGNRRGFCEQISTSLAVMLRTLGIPSREATGYVPGSYNPITDLYSVQAKDAHAWVQVWFPGFGWQSFDPTALVATVNPSPAATLGHDAIRALHRVPVLPSVLVLSTLALALLVVRRRRLAPASAEAAVSAALERAARRAGLDPAPSESLSGLAARIDAHAPPPAGRPDARTIAGRAEESAFGGRALAGAVADRLVGDARGLARRMSRRPPGRRRAQAGLDAASASSNEAPAASRGR